MPTMTTTGSPPMVAPVPFTARIADPGPLGLACFALTTFVLSCFNAGLLPTTVKPVVFHWLRWWHPARACIWW